MLVAFWILGACGLLDLNTDHKGATSPQDHEGHTCVIPRGHSRPELPTRPSRAMSAASKVKPSWFRELKDPSEHKHGKCTWCHLHWGHTGNCAIDFTSNKKTSRRAAVAATTSMKIIRPSFKNGTQVRHKFSDGIYYHGKIVKFNRKNATYKVHFCDGDVVDNMKAEELDAVQQLAQPGVQAEAQPGIEPEAQPGIEPEAQPGVEVEVEVEVDMEPDDVEDEPDVLEASVVFPNIKDFLIKARLETYTHDMKEDGWDDVRYLHEIIKEVADFSKLGGFPIRKPGHRMKMLFALQNL